MKIHVQLEWQDYLKALQLHTAPLTLTRVLVVGAVSIFGVIGFAFLFTPKSMSFVYIYVIVMFASGAYLVVRNMGLPKRAKQIFEQQKDLHLPYEVEITETALVSTNQLGHAEQPWSTFVKWRENDDVLLLYHSDVLFSTLPKRIFNTEQIEAVKAYLKANQVPGETPRRSRPSCLMFIGLAFLLLAFLVWTFQQ
jgi:hypothetical protein